MVDPSDLHVQSKPRRVSRPSFVNAKQLKEKSQSSKDWQACQAILQKMKKRQADQAGDEQELAEIASRLPEYLRERLVEQRNNEGIAIQPPLFAEQ